MPRRIIPDSAPAPEPSVILKPAIISTGKLMKEDPIDTDGACNFLKVSRPTLRKLMNKKVHPVPHEKRGRGYIFYRTLLKAWEVGEQQLP